MIDLKKLKEPLDIDHVDFRIQSINKGGYATILAYKNARVDMERLDEVCGPGNWQRDHKELKGNIYCGIGIRNEIDPDTGANDWVWKWDCGAESYSDKEKGEASDSFKRAGFNWGIGRELYSYPVIQVKLNQNEFELYTVKDKYGKEIKKARQTWELNLKEWIWTLKSKDHKVERLEAVDQKGVSRFKFQLNAKKKEPDDLDIAKAEAAGCKTVKSLEDTWNAYPELHKNTEFKKHINDLKLKL